MPQGIILILITALLCAVGSTGLGAEEFDLSTHSIPLNAIRSGGPPKDGIPAILNPKFVGAEEATFLRDDDLVVGVILQGSAKAYPRDHCADPIELPARGARP